MSDIEPVAWAIFRDGELDWEHDLPFSDEPQSMMDDEESRPLYGGEVIEQLRADAERYRWLKANIPMILSDVSGDIEIEKLDAAIDAAMKEEK